MTTAPTRSAARRVKYAAILLVALAAALFPLIFGGQTYVMTIATQCLVYGLVAVTLNLLVGYGGQISLGHAGLLSIGAYTAAVIATDASVGKRPVPLPLELLAAGLVTAAIGFVLGLPTGRLQGHYLAIATLGFGLAVPQVAENWSALTNGETGISVPGAKLGPWTFGDPSSPQPSMYYLALVVVALCLLAILSLLGTRTGRGFMAVRDSASAALAMGIDVRRTKVVLFTTSAFFCGIAGCLWAHEEGLVASRSLLFADSLIFLAMVIVGGLASVWGSLAGAVLIVVVRELARGSGGTGGTQAQGLSTAIIGLVVVGVLLVLPEGLASLPRRAAALLSRPGRGAGAISARQPAPAQAATETREVGGGG